jgi:TetR/AcrR family transcriptional regulator
MRSAKKINQLDGHSLAAIGTDTREQLLNAATTLFAEQGIAATTVAKIAAQVGVTSAMIHYYFKNRDQLLDAIVEERILRCIAYVWDPITGDESDPVALIKNMVIRIVSTTELMPCLPSLWIREVVSEGGLLREKVLPRIPLDKLQLFVHCIASGQKQGRINPDIDPRLLFFSVLGLTMLPLAMDKVWKQIPLMAGVGKEQLINHAIALLLHGLSHPPSLTLPDSD